MTDAKLTREKWMERYAARIMYVAEWDKESAIAAADAGADAVVEDAMYSQSQVEWINPEEQADDEISCWEDDGDE